MEEDAATTQVFGEFGWWPKFFAVGGVELAPAENLADEARPVPGEAEKEDGEPQ